MNEKQGLLKQYNEEEIKQLLNSDDRLVYIDNGSEEIVARYEDLPDIIVDLNDKLGQGEDLKVYDYKNPDMYNPMLTTFGPFLNKCDSNVRKDIIDRLASLQQGEIEVKDYKVIDEDVLEKVINDLEQDEMER